MYKNTSELKVLVVEDSKATIKDICDYLGHMGIHHPLVAETGQAAINLFRDHRPDIILLDIVLPDIDGFEVARQIRALEQDGDWAAIIFQTNQSKEEHLARGIEAGGDDYLVKPISEMVLISKVKAMRRLVEMQRALVEVTHQMNAANKELQRLSTTDGLTGIANRRFFDELLDREWRRCARMKMPMSLVMIDVDNFKLYNDTYGHQAGDECLKAVAEQVALGATRAGDLAARYGGEEFALILGETDSDGAICLANKTRQRVSERQIPHDPSVFRQVTISCGVATVMPNDKLSLEVLLQSADHALYLAKEQGRNRVVCMDYGQVS